MGVIFLMLYQENECRPHRIVHFPEIEISKPVKKQENVMVFSTLALFHRLQRMGLRNTATALIGFSGKLAEPGSRSFPANPVPAQKQVPMSLNLIISKALIFLLDVRVSLVERTETQTY